MYFYASRAQRKQTTFTSAEVSDELVGVESTSNLWHDTFFIGLQERLVHYAMGDWVPADHRTILSVILLL